MIWSRPTTVSNRYTFYISKEKKNREESEQAIYDMLRDVVSRVKTEIEIERKAR
jgi:hypothetical protein